MMYINDVYIKGDKMLLTDDKMVRAKWAIGESPEDVFRGLDRRLNYDIQDVEDTFNDLNREMKEMFLRIYFHD